MECEVRDKVMNGTAFGRGAGKTANLSSTGVLFAAEVLAGIPSTACWTPRSGQSALFPHPRDGHLKPCRDAGRDSRF